MNTLEVYHDGSHIKGLKVTYFDGLFELHSKQIFATQPLHGSNDGSLSHSKHAFQENEFITEINVGMGKQSIEALEFVFSSGNRFKAGKPDAMMKRLPMEDGTRIVALAGAFDKNSGALKQISAHYFVLDERICIEE